MEARLKILLAIDISNSTIKAGVFLGKELSTKWQFASEINKTADDYAMLLFNLFRFSNIQKDSISGVALSCVVPPLRSVFTEISIKHIGVDPLVISNTINIGVKLCNDNPSELGSDRIANALATHQLYGGPAISISFGTATVFDCISARGEYMGGAIAPGMVGALESLARYAAQLYRVEIVRPERAVGKNTIQMIQSGLVLGYVALVEGVVTRLKQEMVKANSETKFNVIATGGLADIIASETRVIQVVDQHLLLKGLQLIYEMNKG